MKQPTGHSQQYDYVVVGCGVAGTLFSWYALTQGKRVLVYDGWQAGGVACPASRVAPGIINPLAGKRLHPAWRVEAFLPEALASYAEMGRLLRARVFHPLPIIRVLQNAFEAEMLALRESQPAASVYVGERRAAGLSPEWLVDTLGSFSAQGSGWVDLTLLLDGWQRHLESLGLLRREDFPFDALVPHADYPETPEWTAERVVFCQGWKGRDNPWFAGLPFRAAKGEMLDLEWDSEQAVPTFLRESILNVGKWLLPLGEGKYRAGATYAWDGLDGSPTEGAKKEILETLGLCLKAKFRVTGQRVGIRPILRDYRPVLGCHPEYPRLGIFNGLGSKGALTAPWLARRLFAHFEEGAPLEKEYSLTRF